MSEHRVGASPKGASSVPVLLQPLCELSSSHTDPPWTLSQMNYLLHIEFRPFHMIALLIDKLKNESGHPPFVNITPCQISVHSQTCFSSSFMRSTFRNLTSPTPQTRNPNTCLTGIEKARPHLKMDLHGHAEVPCQLTEMVTVRSAETLGSLCPLPCWKPCTI